MRKDWTIWTLVYGVIILMNLGSAAWSYWIKDEFIGQLKQYRVCRGG